MKLKQSLLILSLVVLGVLFAACGGGGTTDTMVKLTVTKAGEGSGTVTSAPQGINLGAGDKTGTKDYTKGAKVTLTATPDASSTFGGFSSNCATAGANTCTITLNAAASVTATFNKSGGGGETPVVNSVTVTPSTLALQVGTTGQLTATVDATGGAADTVTWTSDQEAFATVDANGMVTAVAEGTATITATSTADTTKSASATVTVTTQPPPATVNSVAINEGPQTLNTGDTFQFSATVDVSGGADQSVTWETSDPTVATVDNTGLVTAGINESTATITARSVEDTTKFAEVTVTVDNTAPATLNITQLIGASEDDAEEYTEAGNTGAVTAGKVFINSSDLELNYDAGFAAHQLVGLRFVDLAIPQNATIVDAFIQFEAKESSSTPGPVLSIAGEAGLAPAAFVAGQNTNISSRLTNATAATVSWTPDAWVARAAGSTQEDPKEKTPDLKAIVQENVNAGQVDALVFIISGDATNNLRNAWAFDDKSGGTPPKLIVNYTTP